jgi:hypothetical protein
MLQSEAAKSLVVLSCMIVRYNQKKREERVMAGIEKYAIALETGPRRRVFAQALNWIGWCRAGKDEATALHNLFSVGLRYAEVARRAGYSFHAPSSLEAFEAVERIPGTAITDFGAPGVLLSSDQEPFEEGESARLSALLIACWATFDEAMGSIAADQHDVKPEQGRSPDSMRLHLLETDCMHLSAFGHAFRKPEPAYVGEQEVMVREQLLKELQAVPYKQIIAPVRRYGFSWTPRFAALRSAWHALDHAWELQDRWGE